MSIFLFDAPIPSLLCPQDNDKFSVTTVKGNGDLSKSVGLITADEVSMAGGKVGSQNTLYYLYTGTTYWTMSPSNYFPHWDSTYEFAVNSSGNISGVGVGIAYGIRPVINLDTTKVTFTGTGTMQDPYVIS